MRYELNENKELVKVEEASGVFVEFDAIEHKSKNTFSKRVPNKFMKRKKDGMWDYTAITKYLEGLGFKKIENIKVR